MAAGPVGIRLSGIGKSYGGTRAVDNIDLTVAPGEFLTLLGPSGSGKTTLLLIMAGFCAPDSGEVRFGDALVNALPPYRRGIGMVFQNYALFPHMTVFDNVAFPLRVRHLPAAELRQRVAEALALVNLSGLERRRPRELSGGQQQRVSLARALVYRPPILLLDEPLAALDKNLRDQMQIEIRRIHRECGTTTVCVTHDQNEALVMSDRIAVMDAGGICQAGTPADIYDRPASRFVAQFIGESNLFIGHVTAVSGDAVTARIAPGATVTASAKALPVAGERVQFAIRPNRMALGLPCDCALPANAARGVVAEQIFVGDSLVYTVAVHETLSLRARMPRRAGIAAFPVGTEVQVNWSAEDVVVLGSA